MYIVLLNSAGKVGCDQLHWAILLKAYMKESGSQNIGQICDLQAHSVSESERHHCPPRCRQWNSFQLFWTLIAWRSHLHVRTQSSVSPQAKDCTNNHTVARGIKRRLGGKKKKLCQMRSCDFKSNISSLQSAASQSCCPLSPPCVLYMPAL